MSRIWIAVVGASSIASLTSTSGCGAATGDIVIEGPSLRADSAPRSLSYESKRPGGLLAVLSPDAARVAARSPSLAADSTSPLGVCAAAAGAVVGCGASDCSAEIAALDECLALVSLRLRGDDIRVRFEIGLGPLSARECAQLSEAFRGPAPPPEALVEGPERPAQPGANGAAVAPPATELFEGLERPRLLACNQTMQAASTLDQCSDTQVVELNRCLADLAEARGAAVVMDRVLSLRQVASSLGDPLARAGARGRADDLKRAIAPDRVAGPGMSLPAVAVVPSSLESRLINGLADFLANRAREEGLNYLAETVGKNLCERSVRGVQVSSFFAETCRLLRGRDGQANVGLTQFGSAVQKALERDLRGLLPVLLNHATSKLDQTQWRELSPFLAAVLAETSGGTVPTLEKLLAIGRDQIACDGTIDHTCALQLLCITALAVDEARKKSEACQTATWGEACIAAATSRVNEALAHQPKLEEWRRTHIPPDSERRTRLIQELMDRLVEIAQARDLGELKLGQLMVLLRTGVDVVVPAEQRDRIHLLLGQLENGVIRWGELGYFVYHVMDAILAGQDPTPALVAAAENASCTSPADDVGCGVRASGYVASALLSLRGKWPQPGSSVEPFLLEVEKRLAFAIGHPDNVVLREWLRSRFTIGAAPGDLAAKVPLTDVIEQLLGELLAIEAAIEKARDPDADRLVAAAGILNASASLLRNVVSMTIKAEATRARALRVIDGVVEASAAVSKRELAPFMAALYALAVDLGIPDPLPERVRKYVPFVTALTTAETSEQVAAAFRRYAAPVGGYKAKQVPGFHVTASGLVGMAVGVEKGLGNDIDVAGQISAFTPVGLDFTWGGAAGSGLMLSVIDLGALTATRLADDDMEDTEVAFKQVFSPGLYLRVPVKVLGPAVFGAGASMVPALRLDADGQAETIIRGLAFFAIDVTIFEF